MTFWELWALGGLAAWVYMTIIWLVSVRLTDASIVDIFWGGGFVVLALVYYALADGYGGRKLLLTALVTVWGLRLSLHIGYRNWGHGEDYRYQNFRQQFGPERYWWFSYFQVFMLQGGIMWFISTPLLAAQYFDTPAPLTALDVFAAMLWTVGFFFEAVGDLHLLIYKRQPGTSGQVLDEGVWSYTRHPNYFGDAVQWWAYWLIAAVTGWGLLTVYAPLVMTFLLVRVSGVAMLEKRQKETKPKYADYIARVNAFVPGIPQPRQQSEAESDAGDAGSGA